MRLGSLRREARDLLAAPGLRVVGGRYALGRLVRVVALDRVGVVRLSVPVPGPRPDAGELLHWLAERRRVVELLAEPVGVAWRPYPLASGLYDALVVHGRRGRLPAAPPAWRDAAPLVAAWQRGTLGGRPQLVTHGPGALAQARAVLRLLEVIAG